MNGILFLVILGIGYLIYITYGKQLLAEGKKGYIKIGVIVLGLIILLAVATGRANVLLAPLGAAMALITRFKRFIPFLIRYFPQVKGFLGDDLVNAAGLGGEHAGSAGGTQGSGRSRVQTPTLVMMFDHASGAMNGTIKRGQFEGYSLNELSVSELGNLLKQCQASDPEATKLLNVYLAKYHGARFGGGEHQQAASNNSSDMSDQEALDILGLTAGAGRDDIVKAHRALIGKMHPDKGGSTYLATKINAARDHLLKT